MSRQVGQGIIMCNLIYFSIKMGLTRNASVFLNSATLFVALSFQLNALQHMLWWVNLSQIAVSLLEKIQKFSGTCNDKVIKSFSHTCLLLFVFFFSFVFLVNVATCLRMSMHSTQWVAWGERETWGGAGVLFGNLWKLFMLLRWTRFRLLQATTWKIFPISTACTFIL